MSLCIYYTIYDRKIANKLLGVIPSFSLPFGATVNPAVALDIGEVMLVSCKYCGRMHEAGTICPKKPQAKTWGVYDRGEIGVFRRSNAWRMKSEEIRSRDFHVCRVCEAGGHGTFGGTKYNSKGLSVHHITPLAEDFDKRLDNDNLITLCSWHHEMAERGDIPRDELERLATTPLFPI
jgi:hypothetical protein